MASAVMIELIMVCQRRYFLLRRITSAVRSSEDWDHLHFSLRRRIARDVPNACILTLE